MLDYIKRLRLCVKWFQELEDSYLQEQERLRNALNYTQQRLDELGKCFLGNCGCFSILSCLIKAFNLLCRCIL